MTSPDTVLVGWANLHGMIIRVDPDTIEFIGMVTCEKCLWDIPIDSINDGIDKVCPVCAGLPIIRRRIKP